MLCFLVNIQYKCQSNNSIRHKTSPSPSYHTSHFVGIQYRDTWLFHLQEVKLKLKIAALVSLVGKLG